jgi:hypothetical protein
LACVVEIVPLITNEPAEDSGPKTGTPPCKSKPFNKIEACSVMREILGSYRYSEGKNDKQAMKLRGSE